MGELPEAKRMMTARIAASVFLFCALLNAAERPPNILFIFADDMPWKAVAALSGEDIDTPNLDRLAARGTSFDQAFNPGSDQGAVCVPSRTMLNTGRHLWWVSENIGNLREEIRDQGKSWSQRMSAAGYRTGMTGKWHVRMPTDDLFDEVRNQRPGMPRDRRNAYNRPIEGEPDTWDAADPEEGGFWQGGTHWSEVITTDFLDLVAIKDPRPWFLYVAFNAPHDPRQSPQEYLDRYPLDRIRVPENFVHAYPHRDPMGAPHDLRDENLAPMPRTEFAVQTHRREFYAIISHLDTQVGRILDAVDAMPDGKNTVIVFTADHGLAVGEHGLMGKQNMYDHSMRVPFLIAGPGIPQGKRTNAPIYLQDVMPTTLEIAGAEVTDDVYFESFLPALYGDGSGRDAVYGAYRMHQRMVQVDGKKLILYPEARVFRVFDLNADPHEKNDLAETPEGLAMAKRLFARLLELQKEKNDPLDLVEVFAGLVGNEH